MALDVSQKIVAISIDFVTIFDAVVLKRLASKVTLFVRSFCLQAILVLILKLSSLYNRINSKRQITRRCDDGKSMADQQ